MGTFHLSQKFLEQPYFEIQHIYMDCDGIPLAFSIHYGNTNEHQTLKPLEQKIINDFKLSKFVVCTDAGLSSNDNRKFNDIGERAFITFFPSILSFFQSEEGKEEFEEWKRQQELKKQQKSIKTE